MKTANYKLVKTHYKLVKTMKYIKYIIITLLLTILISIGDTFAQMPGYLSGRMTIGENSTLINGNLTIGSSSELFLGSNQPLLQQRNTLYKIGNYKGIAGARIYISVADNSNEHGTRGHFNIVGTANGSTEIILDIFNNWDGSRIDLARAHNAGSNSVAFTMQEGIYNGREAYLETRIEGNDRVWFLAERITEEECLPSLIVQKRNNTLVVDNNPMSNGGFNFVYYKWYRNDELIHEGSYGSGLGGFYNTGTNSLNPYDTYHVLVIDQYGNEHRSCPYNPTIFVPQTKIIAYPNPTTTSQSLVMVDVQTNDTELLDKGTIIVYNLMGQRIKEVRTNGHRVTPIQLPQTAGTYLFRFVSGDVQEVIKIIVY